MGMRFIVTGSRGQLGRCLVRSLEGRGTGHLTRALSRTELDLEDSGAIARIFEGISGGPPDVLVNAAAFTAVDRCESEMARAWKLNAEVPGALAQACLDVGVQMVHVSTDYVFDGEARRPYAETAAVAPRSAYGRSKLEGERRVLDTCADFLVVRTSWVYGPGRNFLGSILGQAEKRQSGLVRDPLRVVDDQRGIPTYAADLAGGLLALADQGANGILHLCNQADPEGVTWWDLARTVLDLSNYRDLPIERIRTADLNLPARRPMYSMLDCSRAAEMGVRLRPWRDAVVDFLASPDVMVMRNAE